MALTVLFALGGSMILSQSFMPAMASIFLPKKSSEDEVFVVRIVKWFYEPIVTRAIKHPVVTIATALTLFAISLPMGTQFMPRLEEGDLLVEALRLPSDGAEMQRPLATVVIGGLITSTLFTSLFVPCVYPWFARGLTHVKLTHEGEPEPTLH